MKNLSTTLEAPLPVRNPQVIPLLRDHPFAQGFSEEHLKLLSEFAMPTEFSVGQLILRENDIANRFYLILEGTVSLETYVKDQGITSIQTLSAGDVLGWSWLFPPYQWRFDARVVTHTKALFFYGTVLRELCERDRDFGYVLMRRTAEILVNRLQSSRNRLVAALKEAHIPLAGVN